MDTNSIYELTLNNETYGIVTFKAFFNNDTNNYLYQYFPQSTMYVCKNKAELKKLIKHIKTDLRFIEVTKENKGDKLC